jgi:hypothetical protein
VLLKSKWFIFVSALVCMSNTFATKELPLACPNASAIQEGGLMGSIPFFNRSYMTYTISSYDTSSNWTFVMGPIVAKSEKNALDKGLHLLTTLSGNPSPQQSEEGDWACLYHTKNPKVVAAAVLSEGTISPSKLRNLLSRP